MKLPGGDHLITYMYRVISHSKTIAQYEEAFQRAKETTGIVYSPKDGHWGWPLPFPRNQYLEARFPDGEVQVIHLTRERAYEDIDGPYGTDISHYSRFANEVIPNSGMKVDPEFVVLDCACGSGYGSNLIHKTHKCRVFGVDVSADIVKYDAKRYAGSATLSYLHDDATVLSNFKDASVNAVISVETIEHVPDAQKALAGFHRVLKPGGVLYVTSPDATERPGTIISPYHVKEWTFDEFSTMLKAQFSVTNISRVDGYLIGVCRK